MNTTTKRLLALAVFAVTVVIVLHLGGGKSPSSDAESVVGKTSVVPTTPSKEEGVERKDGNVPSESARQQEQQQQQQKGEQESNRRGAADDVVSSSKGVGGNNAAESDEQRNTAGTTTGRASVGDTIKEEQKSSAAASGVTSTTPSPPSLKPVAPPTTTAPAEGPPPKEPAETQNDGSNTKPTAPTKHKSIVEQDIPNTVAVKKPSSIWHDDADLTNITLPDYARSVILEVTSNAQMSFMTIARDTPGAFYIGVEPVLVKKAAQTCMCFGGGKCKTLNFAVGVHEQTAMMNLSVECSALSASNSAESNVTCKRPVRSRIAKVVRLDTLIAYALPHDMPVRLLVLDMQGFDLYGAASLSDKHLIKRRVANLIIECQDLPVGDSQLVSPVAKTCGEVISCITENWGYTVVGCNPHTAVRGYSCGFFNPFHEDGNQQIRHPFKRRKKKRDPMREKMDYPAECPAMFTNIKLVPELPVPSSAANTQKKRVPSSSTTVVKPDSIWANDPSLTNITFPDDTEFAIIEVGTNAKPDYLPLASNTPGAFLIGLEPIVTSKATETCTCHGNGQCQILKFAVGPHEQLATMNIATWSECSSLLPLNDTKGMCNTMARTRTVKVIRLDTLIAYAIPHDMPVRLLMLDMQGFDVFGAASLTEKHFLKNRVANFLLECQDYPVGDPRFISQGAKSCGEAISCITQHWGYTFVGCTLNMGPEEYNCMFYNPDHKDGDPNLRHPLKTRFEQPRKALKFPAECPAMFTNMSMVPTLPTPNATTVAELKPRVVKPDSIWADDPELLNITMPKNTKYAMIEVGTNKRPDYLPLVIRSPNAFLIGLEPIVTRKAVQTCTCYGGGKCKILNFALGPHEQKALMNVAAYSECSSLLPLNDTTNNVHCNKKSRSRIVKVIRLDTLIAYAIPHDMPVRLLMLDMQGFDVFGAASLTEKHFLKNRVANFLLECQDYPVGDPRFISQGAKSCGEAISCITQHYGYVFVGCTINMGPEEYNCMFYNPEHEDADQHLRHPYMRSSSERPKKEMNFPAECPAMFTNIDLVPKLPTPNVSAIEAQSQKKRQVPNTPRVKPDSIWANDPSLTNITFPDDTEFAIIEVGTNAKAQYLTQASDTPGAFLIGLEPIVTRKATQSCTCDGGGQCKILNFAVGARDQKAAVMNVARSVDCSTLLGLNETVEGVKVSGSVPNDLNCRVRSRTQTVPVITLDTLIAYALPSWMPIRFLALGMQGYDVYGAASLTEKHFLKNRVANFLLECQDYPVGDPRFISQGAKSCGEAISCITQHWGYKFVGCSRSTGLDDYNCMFYNPDHEDGDRNLRHPYWKSRREQFKKQVDYPAKCPAMFTNIDLVPKLSTP